MEEKSINYCDYMYKEKFSYNNKNNYPNKSQNTLVAFQLRNLHHNIQFYYGMVYDVQGTKIKDTLALEVRVLDVHDLRVLG